MLRQLQLNLVPISWVCLLEVFVSFSFFQVADEHGLETGLSLPQASGAKVPAQKVRQGSARLGWPGWAVGRACLGL